MTEQSLPSKVSEWLHKTGLPLEVAAASAFKVRNFEVTHSAVYADPQSDKGREIDVVAYLRDGTGLLQFYVVIECKASPNPWVVLVSSSPSGNTYSSLGLSTQKTRKALSAEDLSTRHKLGSALQIIHVNGYGLRQAFCKDNDPAYAACISVMKAAKVQLEESRGKTERYKFVVPIIVVDAPIFECSIADDGKLRLREVDCTSLNFTAYIPDRLSCTVRVAHKRSLGFLARQMRRISDETFTCLQYKVDEWVQSLRKD